MSTLTQTKTSSSSKTTLTALYSRAVRVFLQRDTLQTQQLIESAFSIIPRPPPTSSGLDVLASQRRKWDVLRITLESTLAASSAFGSNGVTVATSPTSPAHTLESTYNRSLLLFTPSSLSPSPTVKASSASLPYLPAQVLVALSFSALKLSLPQHARTMIEEWLTHRGSDPEFDSASAAREGKEKEELGYEKVMDCYLLHVLPRLGEWEYAREFLRFEGELSREKKQTLVKALRALYIQTSSIQHSSPATSQTLPNGHTLSDASTSPPLRPKSAASSSSSSSASTYTAVPATPRPQARLKRSTPLPTSSPISHSQSTTPRPTHENRISHPHPPPAPPLSFPSSASESGEASLEGLSPLATAITLIRTNLLPQLRSKLPFLLLFIFPLLALFALRKRRRERRGILGMSGSRAEEVRRRLERSKGVWKWFVRAVKDTVVMGGRGLV